MLSIAIYSTVGSVNFFFGSNINLYDEQNVGIHIFHLIIDLLRDKKIGKNLKFGNKYKSKILEEKK